jgi:lipoyl(octanoyl) transferase
MKKWRFIDTGSNDCYSNMAIDEALFQAYEPGRSMPIFRVYAWNPAAFSIGLSQDPVALLDIKECERAGIGFVRRMTGGGVIFHDKELTYSIICSEKDIEKTYFAKEVYRTLCSFLIRAYQNMGLDAGFSLISDKPPKSGWVCFKQKERYDIVVNGKKIGGNAQRRKRDLIFQHGSIPIQLSPEKYRRFLINKTFLEKSDTCSLSGAMESNISFCELKQNLLSAFRQSLDADLIDDTLNLVEKNLQQELLQSKYNTKEWNFFRNAGTEKALVA